RGAVRSSAIDRRRAPLIGWRRAIGVQPQHLSIERAQITAVARVITIVQAHVQFAVRSKPHRRSWTTRRATHPVHDDHAIAEPIAHVAIADESKSTRGGVDGEDEVVLSKLWIGRNCQ